MLYVEKLVQSIKDSYELPNKVLEAVQEPKVTVGTITYNHIPFIEQCIEGVLIQKTDFPFEYIIGEDFSTDGTREIIFGYARKYPEIIRVITADYNVGANANSLRCFKAFRGQYVALCEGDDYWTDPLKLQKQVDFLEDNPEYVMCYHQCLVKHPDKPNMMDYIKPKKGRDYTADELVATPKSIQIGTRLFRNVFKEQGNDFPLEYFGDYFMNAYLGTFGKCKFLSTIKPSVYNKHAGGIWSSLDDKSKIYHGIRTHNEICNYFIERYFIEKNDDRWARICLKVLKDYLKEKWEPIEYPGNIKFKVNLSSVIFTFYGMRFEIYYKPWVEQIKRNIRRIYDKY
jgi:glycosyltransferase involved in cell wall biosynthesis